MPFGGLLTAGISAGTSLLGGIFGSNAAAKQAAALKQTGIDVAHSYEKATQQAVDAGYAGINQANTALDTGLGAATGAIEQGRDAALAGVGTANQALTDAYGRQIGFLNPYMQAGQQGLSQLQAFLGPGGAGTRPFTADMMSQYDPGYQFRLQQASNQLAKSAAARGGSLGGGFAKSLANYSQNLASSEFANASDRYTRGQQQQYAMLSGLAGLGMPATSQAAAAAGALGQGISGNTMLGANYNYNAGTALANANLGVGSQKANIAQQGNQWIGQMGLTGAEAAGNAYMWGATGNAQGRNAATGALWGGIGNAAGAIGGGLLNYYQNPYSTRYAGDWGSVGSGSIPSLMDPSQINWNASLQLPAYYKGNPV